jgi:signal transduction histidine kinase
VEEACTFFGQQARNAALSLEVAIEAGVPAIITGDVRRLRQVLTNLMGNAVKFTERGGVKVKVSCSKDEARVDALQRKVRLYFAVTDTGIGIPSNRVAELFRPFAQVDSSSKRRRGGTGLGLIISKRLCDLMGGSISVDSRLGEGTTFHFSILADYDERDPLALARASA